MAGRMVETLINGERAAGKHKVPWGGKDSNGRQVASGVYLYRIEAGSFRETKTMVLVKRPYVLSLSNNNPVFKSCRLGYRAFSKRKLEVSEWPDMDQASGAGNDIWN